ncbi:hypothetical protein [Nonomuraea jiangxiensis]|uniref:Uncharacterized protein n=1 Tax=Nonomuraea jiangxiensis TaxID=633440 RepID=A0A1G9LRS7_9ACTN|nr:hypothetical protein [Nonomuraea jiangxiensis]SDL64487.1 hypothetical protein SAMN05421869_12893 [Nonomuraea jiangxiensis]
MMATQEQIDAARRTIEQLRDQHAHDVLKLIRLLEDGAMKGKAADKLIKDCEAWDAAYKSVFRRALTMLESVPVTPGPAESSTDPLTRPYGQLPSHTVPGMPR